MRAPPLRRRWSAAVAPVHQVSESAQAGACQALFQLRRVLHRLLGGATPPPPASPGTPPTSRGSDAPSPGFAATVGLRSRRDLLRFGDDLVEIGKRLLLAALPGPADDAPRIHYEDRPIGHAGVARHVFPAHAVCVNHPSFEIGDQIERETAELLEERLVREDAVDADAVQPDPGLTQLVLP